MFPKQLTDGFSLLCYYAAWGGSKSTFRDYLSALTSRVKLSKLQSSVHRSAPLKNSSWKFSVTIPCREQIRQWFSGFGCRNIPAEDLECSDRPFTGHIKTWRQLAKSSVSIKVLIHLRAETVMQPLVNQICVVKTVCSQKEEKLKERRSYSSKWR